MDPLADLQRVSTWSSVDLLADLFSKPIGLKTRETFSVQSSKFSSESSEPKEPDYESFPCGVLCVSMCVRHVVDWPMIESDAATKEIKPD